MKSVRYAVAGLLLCAGAARGADYDLEVWFEGGRIALSDNAGAEIDNISLSGLGIGTYTVKVLQYSDPDSVGYYIETYAGTPPAPLVLSGNFVGPKEDSYVLDSGDEMIITLTPEDDLLEDFELIVCGSTGPGAAGVLGLFLPLAAAFAILRRRPARVVVR